jgi:hypothetical protein
MNRLFFTVTFAIGLAAVLWVGVGFVGSSPLALLMTAVIAGVYGLGRSSCIATARPRPRWRLRWPMCRSR